MLFVLGALDIYIENYSYESVFLFLLLGFGNLTGYEIDVLEKLLSCAKYHAWLNGENWERTLKIHKNNKTASEKFIADVNSAREKFISTIKPFHDSIKGRKSGICCPRALFISRKTADFFDAVKAKIENF
ncbi:MAG: hypothetical protein L6V93_07535 [Clostridiales bacterium]|nr:MAG: hypothetical protein L6V93_07535 [Clostridiales bacterium]